MLSTACDNYVTEAFNPREPHEKKKLRSLMRQNEYETDDDKPAHMLL
jgi:hypothetical protein